MVMDFYKQVSDNKRMTVLMFLGFFVLIGALAGVISILLGGLNVYGFTYFTIFGVLTIIFALVSYYSCD